MSISLTLSERATGMVYFNSHTKEFALTVDKNRSKEIEMTSEEKK